MGNAQQASHNTQGVAASLLNGLAVLEAFSIEKPVLGVTEIAHRVDLHKSTVSRILNGLVEAGYIQRDEDTGRFRLGLGVIMLSGPLLADLDVRRAALPFLEDITAATKETAAISVWNGAEAIVVEQVASPHQVKHSAAIGTHYPRYESSSVRVFLAELPTTEVDQLLEEGTITIDAGSGAPLPVAGHLEHVREAGHAVNDGFTTDEEYGISAPVRDYRGIAVGCITVSAPRSRVYKQSCAETLAAAVQEAAEQVSGRLGAPAPARTAGTA
ncbi:MULTISPECIES: IclR family transcriptional regulator [Micrococcaceae]|uniref:Glycerol operon regulatory protein n=1 Tax=Arthrobacter rhombi TaxID=71253 RepID=A0A1R4FNJ0_9MICC|nr:MULTISPECIES: IclR family transcriptional regulator [Micrococcaceae]PCC25080.1 IclR family transcriptional regulator [Glutamicibacter sp. BW78]SJM57312.1 Transcriptional regulator, IclR family [Arthrobacter rhombi]